MWVTSRRALAIVLMAAGALVAAATATAATETFHRFEVLATANYTLTEDCGDGTTATLRVQVRAGHEEESENGEVTQDQDFLLVRIFGFDCEGNFVNDQGTGSADFEFSPSLQTASVTGTVTTRQGRTVDVDMSWEGEGELRTTNNVTTFPGFVGHFQGRERDAVATGTVVVDGETLVDGSTTNAQIETLEDNNTRTGQG